MIVIAESFFINHVHLTYFLYQCSFRCISRLYWLKSKCQPKCFIIVSVRKEKRQPPGTFSFQDNNIKCQLTFGNWFLVKGWSNEKNIHSKSHSCLCHISIFFWLFWTIWTIIELHDTCNSIQDYHWLLVNFFKTLWRKQWKIKCEFLKVTFQKIISIIN